MTIKDFSKLCNCNTQTLRYYDSIGLLKPVRVDSYTGYRHYNEEQALDFVRIKNLQEASFSIEEIKSLLCRSDDEIFKAFEDKILEQKNKLNRIIEIQQSYRNEYMRMKDEILKIQEQLLESSSKVDAANEYGISTDLYEEIISNMNKCFEDAQLEIEKHSLPFDEEDIEKVKVECPLKNGEYSVIFEKSGWNHAKEIVSELENLDGEYHLYFKLVKEKCDNISFASIMLGITLSKNEGKKISLLCTVDESEDEQNHFWLLKK